MEDLFSLLTFEPVLQLKRLLSGKVGEVPDYRVFVKLLEQGSHFLIYKQSWALRPVVHPGHTTFFGARECGQ
jgi:hypothetical protein